MDPLCMGLKLISNGKYQTKVLILIPCTFEEHIF